MAHHHLVELLYGTPASTITSLPLPEPDDAGTHSHQTVWSRGETEPYQGHFHVLVPGEDETGPDDVAQIEQYRYQEENALD